MMYRDVELLPEKTVGDSGTETVDLDVTDPITELVVRLGLTNGAATADQKIPTDIISKIEIVDGGTVYASVTGPEAAGIAFYESGVYPPCWYTDRASNGQNIALPLYFGRYVGDPLRNLDVSKMRNPQIKVTWSKDTLHLTGYVKLYIRARVLTDVPGAASALLVKNVRTFTTAASGDEDTELPTDYPIRRLFVRPYKASELPYQVVSHYKLDCDEGRFIPFDLAAARVNEEVKQTFGRCTIRQLIVGDNATFPDSFLGIAEAAFGSCETGLYIVNCFASGTPYINFHLLSDAGAGGSEVVTEMTCLGYLPHYVYAFPFGLKDDPATWFPAPAYRKVKLRLTQGVASGTCSILVQQDRPL